MFWKRHPQKFFTPEDQRRIVEEIRRAESRTSGEIHVHLDCCAEPDALTKAKKVFGNLGLFKTRRRNGVLIYLATEDREFAVLGDEGIHGVVPGNYWEAVKEKMQEYFRQGKFGEGVCFGIREIGEKLKTHFPFEPGDVNELPDPPSRGRGHEL